MACPKDVLIEMAELLENGKEVRSTVRHASRTPERIEEQEYRHRRRQQQQQFYRPAGTEIAEAVQECHVL